jgi:hypothetical protein
MMNMLSRTEDIWILKPTKEDLIAGAQYASVTLPWTFNRMMMNTTSPGQQSRALNIAKGIVGQEMLRRALLESGVSTQVQRKSHRDEDLFDFRILEKGVVINLDVKSVNYYSNYADTGRVPLSLELMVENAGYPGPDWRHFFPMLVPHTQIAQDKQAYCFAITSSIDFRRDVITDRVDYSLTAFPYGEVMAFMGSKKLCLARESVSKGFYIECFYRVDSLFNSGGIRLVVLGEWEGKIQKVPVYLKKERRVPDIGPFSCVSSFQIERGSYEGLDGQIEISVCRNDFKLPVYNSYKQNINVKPDNIVILARKDFCNLILPSGYTMYVIGWLKKEEFLQGSRKYTGWVWPLDKVNKYENQAWTMITEKDKKMITHYGFEDCIQKKPSLLKAGWMKTSGKGGGACCYVFPNIGGQSGVKETNLYVLPQDLKTMSVLGRQKWS